MEFAAFIKDMGKRPKGLMLERKDNDAGYSPQNCIWADRMTQNNNSRNNVKIKTRFAGLPNELSGLPPK